MKNFLAFYKMISCHFIIFIKFKFKVCWIFSKHMIEFWITIMKILANRFRHESQFKKWVFHSKIFDWKSHIGQKKYFLNTHSISILLTLSYRPQGTQKNKKNIFLAFSYAIYKFIVCHFNKMNDILKIVLIFFGLLHFYEQNYRKMLDD